MIGFGVPWCALGPKSLYSDSGFLLVYEMLTQMYERHGTKSLIYIEPRYAEAFDERNAPAESGVWRVSCREGRASSRTYDTSVSNDIANDYLASARKCPIDFVITNKRLIVPSLAALTEDRVSRFRIPLYLQSTMAGREGIPSKVPIAYELQLQLQVASFMTATRVLWPTRDQASRGKAMCRRFLSASTIRDVFKRSALIGGGITDLVKKVKVSDEDVRKRLQSKKKDFRVSFVGRMNSVKNVSFIIDTMRTMFALNNVSLEVVSVGELSFPRAYKKVKDERDAKNIVGRQELGGRKGRDYYANTILPNLDVGISATITECHPATPREGVFVGVPWLIPSNRAWGPSLFGADYPFMFGNDAECIAQVKRIKNGQVTDAEVDVMLRIRRDPKRMWFMSTVADAVYGLAKRDRLKVSESKLTRVVEAWEDYAVVGGEFVWGDMTRALTGKPGVTISDNPMKARSEMEVYAGLRKRIECVNPERGIFRRLR